MNASLIICPCGLSFEGTPKEALAMYRAHRCPLHEPEPHSPWAGALSFIALLVFLSFVCTHGWGFFR